jgi:hypothetical protein
VEGCLCIIVVVLLVAASIVNAASGGDLSVSTGSPEPPPGLLRGTGGKRWQIAYTEN